ncbi:MAG: hypothetical protein IJZ88_04880 [Clostridia bacterium]|nr:hypothetical protein [Clostridia bacterium]
MNLSKKLLACLLAILVLTSFSFISSAKTLEDSSYCFSSSTDAFASETDDYDDCFNPETDGDFASETDSEDECCGIIAFFKNIINKIVNFFTNIFVFIGLS